jgi:hypothetical protein
MPFQPFGSRRSLCFMASVIAWPLTFWIVATLVGNCVEPRPIDIASGIGLRKCDASCSRFTTLSRISAQPAVLFNCTLRPCCL